jgi:hypothetical protein
MKRFIILGIAAAALMLALPAYAQTPRPSAGGMTSPLSTTGGGGGGGYGSGGGGADTNVNKLPSYPRACLSMAAVSGTRAEYVPSTFVAYDKAVADGHTVDDTPAPTVADAARAQRAAAATSEKSKFTVVQNYYGYPIAIPR